MGRQAPARIKDRQYYKKLLDRYFGQNHALANEGSSKGERGKSRSLMHNHANCVTNYHGNVFCQSQNDTRQFPQVRLSYSTSDKKVVLMHQPFLGNDDSDNEDNFFDQEVGSHNIAMVTMVITTVTRLEAGLCCGVAL